MTTPSPNTTAATAAAAPRSVAFAFAPGWYLYPGADGSWRLATPTGAFVRVNGEPEALRACASGQRASGDDALIAGLRARGALTEPTSAQAAAPGVWREELQRRLTVHVEGDDPVAEAAIALLAPQAEVVTGTLLVNDRRLGRSLGGLIGSFSSRSAVVSVKVIKPVSPCAGREKNYRRCLNSA